MQGLHSAPLSAHDCWLALWEKTVEFDSAPHSQGALCSWEARPRWKIQDCPLFALKMIQRKEMKAWGSGRVTRRPLNPRPGLDEEKPCSTREKGAWQSNYAFKVGFGPFYYTLSLFAQRKTKRRFLRAFYYSWPCTSLNSVKSISRTWVQSEDWRLQRVMGSFLGSLELPQTRFSIMVVAQLVAGIVRVLS